MLAAMARKIALPVAVNIKTSDRASALNWLFPNPGVNRLVMPLDMARKANINRD
jgi:hypothetical protein